MSLFLSKYSHANLACFFSCKSRQFLRQPELKLVNPLHGQQKIEKRKLITMSFSSVEKTDMGNTKTKKKQTVDNQMKQLSDKRKNEWKLEKEKYMNMNLTEKRKFYKCGSKYIVLDNIESWPDYANKLLESRHCRGITGQCEPDELLNMKVSMWRGDITALEIDAITNAANKSLLGGGGVDGAIHSAAGGTLLKECVTIGGCDTGDAKVTGGYKLPAKYIIHTVGPIGVNPQKLMSCYTTCLNLATEHNIRTIAFPCISTGIYGYDIEKATPVVMTTVKEWLLDGDNKTKIDKIIFCVFLKKDVEVYEHNMLEYFPVVRSQKNSGEEKENAKDTMKPKDADKQDDQVNSKTLDKTGSDEDKKLSEKDCKNSSSPLSDSKNVKRIKTEDKTENYSEKLQAKGPANGSVSDTKDKPKTDKHEEEFKDTKDVGEVKKASSKNKVV